jgi:hypothetical protein
VEILLMNHSVMVVLAVCCMMFAFPPRAKAIDPITMAILAPVAMKLAEASKPYVIRSMIGTGKGVLNIGKAAIEILYLLLGLGEITIGLPLKKGRSGLKHLIRGGVIAPAKIVVHTLLLPVYMTGAKINI